MKTSARNKLKGTITSIRSDNATAHINIDIGNGNSLSSVITNDAVNDLSLKEGDSIEAVIKSTSVMINK